jgi:hypothetical protein
MRSNSEDRATNPIKIAYLLIHEPSQKTIATNVFEARTVWERGVGLIGMRALSENDGLRLTKTSSIHTLGMNFSIDLLFLDRSGKCLGYKYALPPNRIALAPKGACEAVELAKGGLRRIESLQIGDRFLWRRRG